MAWGTKKEPTWGIGDEKRFLDGLGTWTEKGDKPRLPLLRQYLAINVARKEKWQPEALKYCQELIRQEEKEGSTGA